ncbi:MAG: M20/M25/M40 family metallo-hydrolase [Pyramidobacter sp.]|nr:M20/M25/M40 family metallo-hydrolase [Pyramidobacter sp.]MBP3750992.1 M20/M25/M40 family metallo-hydrolase [Pyramidobacter sp.]MBP3837317.1 M20/M25/M40 family metallo-hydrolase [Pyramidobacter sp.]
MARHRMVDEFIELAQIDAETKNERRMADRLKEKLEALGFSVTEDEAGETIGGNAGNLYAVLPGELPGELMFCAHMDRVPPGNGICPVVDEAAGTITSDGSTILAADDLAGVEAILEGVRQAVESGQPHQTIEVVFTVCEEISLQGSLHFDCSRLRSKIGYVLDTSGAVGRIVSRAPYKGVLTLDVWGKASHAGNYPERGVNAIMAAAHILDGLPEGRLGPEATSNFGVISGGSNIGTVCDHVTIQAELRNHDKDGLLSYLEEVKSHCRKRISETQARLEIKFEIAYDGFRVDEDEAVMRRLLDAMRAMGVEPSIQMGMGGMDANNFCSRGLRCVGVAVGYNDPHALYEKITIPEFIKAAELVRRIVLSPVR